MKNHLQEHEGEGTRGLMLAQLYAQKFLSYLIAYISSYIVYLTIIFGSRDKTHFLKGDFYPSAHFSCNVLPALPFLILLAVFGFYTYRTFVEMYAIEKETGTITEVAQMVDRNLNYWIPFYNLTRPLTIPGNRDAGCEGRKGVIWIFLVIVLLSIYSALLFLPHGCCFLLFALIMTFILFSCDGFLTSRRLSLPQDDTNDNGREETPSININAGTITVINQRIDP